MASSPTDLHLGTVVIAALKNLGEGTTTQISDAADLGWTETLGCLGALAQHGWAILVTEKTRPGEAYWRMPDIGEAGWTE